MKPKTMKPVKAWGLKHTATPNATAADCIVSRAFGTRESAKEAALKCDKVIRVEIRELQPKKRGKK